MLVLFHFCVRESFLHGELIKNVKANKIVFEDRFSRESTLYKLNDAGLLW